jgi:hypothetical protein
MKIVSRRRVIEEEVDVILPDDDDLDLDLDLDVLDRTTRGVVIYDDEDPECYGGEHFMYEGNL